MFFYLLQGATLALPATLMPGPFQAFLIACSLKNGWKRTLPAAFAPLATDGPVIILVMFVLAKTPKWSLNVLHIAGGFVILYFAWKILASMKIEDQGTGHWDHAARQTLLGAIGMNILNPNPYIFWSVVAGPILLQGWRKSATLGIGFITGFYGTFVISLALFIIAFGTVGRVNKKIYRILSMTSAWVLLAFGFYEIGIGVYRVLPMIF